MGAPIGNKNAAGKHMMRGLTSKRLTKHFSSRAGQMKNAHKFYNRAAKYRKTKQW